MLELRKDNSISHLPLNNVQAEDVRPNKEVSHWTPTGDGFIITKGTPTASPELSGINNFAQIHKPAPKTVPLMEFLLKTGKPLME